MGNQQQKQTPYQGNQGYQCRNNANYGQGWRQDAGPSNRKNPYHNFNHNYTYLDRTSKLEDTLNQFMKLSIVNQKNTDPSIQNLET